MVRTMGVYTDSVGVTSFSTEVPVFPYLYVYSDTSSPHANELRFLYYLEISGVFLFHQSRY